MSILELQDFTVTLRPANSYGDDDVEVFCCQADDAEHAWEQAENAYPGSTMLSVDLGDPD